VLFGEIAILTVLAPWSPRSTRRWMWTIGIFVVIAAFLLVGLRLAIRDMRAKPWAGHSEAPTDT
jgi:hypothetical protein